jgi:AcrR family transcriptional regulator
MKALTPIRARANSDVRRRAIAAAARALIAERGFEGLRTRDIADRVGINIATLHYHLPTKEALIELVAQSMRDDFIAQSMAWRREGLTPLQELQHEMADFRETMEHQPELFAVLAEMVERARRDPKVDAAVRPLQAYWHQQIVDVLTRGRRDGSFRPDLDPRAAATMVTGAMAATLRPPFQGVSQFDRVAAELLRALVNPSR